MRDIGENTISLIEEQPIAFKHREVEPFKSLEIERVFQPEFTQVVVQLAWRSVSKFHDEGLRSHSLPDATSPVRVFWIIRVVATGGVEVQLTIEVKVGHGARPTPADCINSGTYTGFLVALLSLSTV